jgi:chemosensory pili system protein ChpA (sensor histidine kinase/response regulator)
MMAEDLVAIEEKAIAYGLIPPGTVLSEAELQRLILHSGFSTRETVTETSGRGVGMDIVNDRIKGLKGRLDISSAYGEGSQFTVHVPARSGVAHALVVQASGDLVAIPLEQITTIVAAGLAEFTVKGENVYVTYQEQRLPAFVLGQWLNLEHLSANDVIEKEFEWIPVLVHGAKGECLNFCV